jgi:hypothetical protein
MAYGSAAGVAAFTPRYVSRELRQFDAATTPTLTQVDAWRAQISAMLDVSMSAAGLPAPATHADVVPMLDGFVNSSAAWLVETVNGQGRYQERPIGTREALDVIRNAALEWVSEHAAGIGAISGAIASTTPVITIGGLTRVDDQGRSLEYIAGEWA